MILEVFITFIVICFVLIFLGFYTQIKVTALVGFIGLFLIGLMLQASSVTSQNGLTETVTGNVTVTTYNYTSLNDSTTLWLGRWLAISSALGFILTIISNKNTEAK
jgi:hypothetical protein